MKKTNDKKSEMTIDKLAQMVARGFENTATKDDIAGVNLRIDKLEKKISDLTDTLNNLANKLGHYIDLHEERYLDLKHKFKSLYSWAEKASKKLNIPLAIDAE